MKTEDLKNNQEYKYGFTTDVENIRSPKGLNEDVIRFISNKKNEPSWLLDWRLDAYKRWLTMDEPDWSSVRYPSIDYQDSYYYSAPKDSEKLESLDDVDPKLLETYNKLGIPLKEQEWLAGVAVDAVFETYCSKSRHSHMGPCQDHRLQTPDLQIQIQ